MERYLPLMQEIMSKFPLVTEQEDSPSQVIFHLGILKLKRAIFKEVLDFLRAYSQDGAPENQKLLGELVDNIDLLNKSIREIEQLITLTFKETSSH